MIFPWEPLPESGRSSIPDRFRPLPESPKSYNPDLIREEESVPKTKQKAAFALAGLLMAATAAAQGPAHAPDAPAPVSF